MGCLPSGDLGRGESQDDELTTHEENALYSMFVLESSLPSGFLVASTSNRRDCLRVLFSCGSNSA